MIMIFDSGLQKAACFYGKKIVQKRTQTVFGLLQLTNLNVPVREVVLTDGRDLVYNLSEHMWHLDEEFCLVEGLVQVVWLTLFLV